MIIGHGLLHITDNLEVPHSGTKFIESRKIVPASLVSNFDGQRVREDLPPISTYLVNHIPVPDANSATVISITLGPVDPCNFNQTRWQ